MPLHIHTDGNKPEGNIFVDGSPTDQQDDGEWVNGVWVRNNLYVNPNIPPGPPEGIGAMAIGSTFIVA